MKKQLALTAWWENFTAWWKIFKELDDSRAPITKKTLYVSLLLTVGSAILSNLSSSDILKVLASIVLSVATSVTAAALLDLFFRMRADARFKWDQKTFRTLFNCDLDTRSVAIVLPQFAINQDAIEQAIEQILPEQAPVDFTGWRVHEKAATFTEGYKDIALSDIHSASFCDIVAASRLIAAFAENKLPIPDILWDTEIESKLKGTQYQTFIAVGLFSNHLTALVNEQPALPQRLFRLQVGSKSNTDLYDYCRILLQRPGKPEQGWKDFRLKPKADDGVPDVALFAKVPFAGKSVLICGGTTAEATQKLGNYLYEKWQEISTWQDDVDAKQTVDNTAWFAITFEIDVYKNDGSDSVVKDVSRSGVRVVS
jgi:hypothetical protein